MLEAVGIPDRPGRQPLESLAIEWDGAPHFGSMSVGYSSFYESRRLVYILRSLRIPLDHVDGLDVARQIGIDGDWVVRRDADLDERMSALETIVRRTGYPGFRITRTTRKQTTYEMRGTAHAPPDTLVILPALPSVPEQTEQTGTLEQFAKALAAAIQHPVAMRAQPAGLTFTWRDNSAAYVSLGVDVSDRTVRELLDRIAASLGVTFEQIEDETTFWELHLR